MSFGQRLKEVKKTYRYSQDMLAEMLGVSKTSINNYFNDNNSPGIDVINKILTNFPEINARWLILGEEEMLKGSSNTASKNIIKGDKNITGNGITKLNEQSNEHRNLNELLAAKDREIEALKKVIDIQEKLIERLTK